MYIGYVANYTWVPTKVIPVGKSRQLHNQFYSGFLLISEDQRYAAS